MRIAYLGVIGAGQHGIARKIHRQLETWIAKGHEARLFVLTGERYAGGSPVASHIDEELLSTKWAYVTRYGALVRRLAAWRPDLVYFRFTPYLPHTEWVVRRFPTVAEMNADDVQQIRVLSSRPMLWRHRLTRGRVLKRVRGIVCVSADVADRNRGFGCPVEVIGNGITLAEFAELPAPNGLQPRLAFLSSRGLPWHGIDKILWLARQCPDWTFDMIGDLGLDAPPQASELPPNVRVHGMLPREAYERVLAQADVALGALALHRYGLDRNSTLKVLEYLAYGIPTIIGYEETHFPEPPWHLLELPNTSDNVQTHLPRLKDFVAAVRGRRVDRASIEHLDIGPTEAKRLHFFEQVLASASAVDRS